jgi:phenylpropionate dioxygenase-like ring-hydroxylating dioxygenase large terminal subunit
MNRYGHGWFQVAFEADLTPPITPLAFAGRSLMAVNEREAGVVRVFDAVCPHRGAHLAYGGRLAAGAVICPFHAYRIGLGASSPDGFRAQEYASHIGAGGVFIRLSDRPGPDFPRALEALGRGHRVVPGFTMTAETAIEVVIENGFDNAHFRSVHGIMNLPSLTVARGEFGELAAEGQFEIPRSGWYESPDARAPKLTAHYVAHAFSPGTFIAELDGDPPFRYRIMTTATPDAEARCTIRLTLILPAGDARSEDERFTRELLTYSRDGLEKDCAIWNRLHVGHVPRFTARDEAARAFGAFCREFLEDGAGA